MENTRLENRGRLRASIIILAAYLWVLQLMQAMATDVEMSVLFAAALCLLSVFLGVILIKTLAGSLSRCKMDASYERPLVCGGAVAALTLIVCCVYLAGNYPGGLISDPLWQYRQATGMEPYNDWHPVLHTLIFYTLPLKTGFNLGVIMLAQLGYFSLAFGYLTYVLCRNGCPKAFLAVICAYVWLDPYLTAYLMYPIKDCGMTIFAIVLMAYYIQTVCSDGAWLERRLNAVLFAAMAVLCAFMRHNAVLFVAPLVLIALFCYLKNKKKRALIITVIAVCFVLIKLLYAAIDVEKPVQRKLESIGLPMTVMCNVMQKCPEVLPEETREVMYRIASAEVYENDYTDCFNSIKWNWKSDLLYVDTLSYGQVIKYTWQCFTRAPKESFEAVAKLTNLVWAVEIDDVRTPVAIYENPFGVVSRPLPVFQRLVDQLWDFLSTGLCNALFGSYGLELLAMLVVGLVLLAAGRVSIVHILPFFCYDFGTMLLLAGRDHRFFMYQLPLWLPLIFLMLRDNKTLAPRETTKKLAEGGQGE